MNFAFDGMVDIIILVIKTDAFQIALCFDRATFLCTPRKNNFFSQFRFLYGLNNLLYQSNADKKKNIHHMNDECPESILVMYDKIHMMYTAIHLLGFMMPE